MEELLNLKPRELLLDKVDRERLTQIYCFLMQTKKIFKKLIYLEISVNQESDFIPHQQGPV